MELLAVKLEKKQNGSTEVYAGKKILGRGAPRWPETLQLLKQLSMAVGTLPNTFCITNF